MKTINGFLACSMCEQHIAGHLLGTHAPLCHTCVGKSDWSRSRFRSAVAVVLDAPRNSGEYALRHSAHVALQAATAGAQR